MIADFISTGEIICSFFQGVLFALTAFAEVLFTYPLLPFTILGIIGFFVKLKAR